RTVYHEAVDTGEELARLGFRVLTPDLPLLPWWDEPPHPWAKPFLLEDASPLTGVKYLLSFRPFDGLPAAVRAAYLKGELRLLPCPASLVFWGLPRYRRLHEELPLALQTPLLPAISRHQAPHGLRVPQSGVLHEPGPHGA